MSRSKKTWAEQLGEVKEGLMGFGSDAVTDFLRVLHCSFGVQDEDLM